MFAETKTKSKMSIFNKDHYPTPTEVLDQMTFGMQIKGRTFYDPSSGSGNIIDYLLASGAAEVLCSEISPDLARLSATKGRLIGSDFLEITSDQISHVDVIIMNPPFSADEKHILHAWDIAPGGCEIVSLCNYETYNNCHSSYRLNLKSVITNNGSILNLGDCFADAERKTGVNIGLVKLFKPKTESDTEFEGYFDPSEEYERQEDGVMQYNELRNIVNRYVGAVKMFNEVMDANIKLNALIQPISNELGITFGANTSRNNVSSNIDRNSFKKELQKSAWKSVFAKLKMDKYVTKKIMEDINKFCETQTNVPFTLANIYKMMEMIVGTQGQRMQKVIVEVFDWLTEHHSENRLIAGWKTNSEYVVNKKFIAPYCGVNTSYAGFPEIAYGRGDRMDDLIKALCHITGQNYDEQTKLEHCYSSYGEAVEYELIKPEDERKEGFSYIEDKRTFEDRDGKKHVIHKIYQFKEEPNYAYRLSSGYNGQIVRYRLFGQWYDWGFFRVRVYKKGTLHAEFKDEQTWVKFNQTAAKAKGFQLASKFKGNFRAKKTGVEIYNN